VRIFKLTVAAQHSMRIFSAQYYSGIIDLSGSNIVATLSQKTAHFRGKKRIK